MIMNYKYDPIMMMNVPDKKLTEDHRTVDSSNDIKTLFSKLDGDVKSVLNYYKSSIDKAKTQKEIDSIFVQMQKDMEKFGDKYLDIYNEVNRYMTPARNEMISKFQALWKVGYQKIEKIQKGN